MSVDWVSKILQITADAQSVSHDGCIRTRLGVYTSGITEPSRTDPFILLITFRLLLFTQ